MEAFQNPNVSKNLYRKAETKYLLKSFKIEEIPTERVIENYKRLHDKLISSYYRYVTKEILPQEENWYKNERKLFVWFLICYADYTKKPIESIVNTWLL